MESFEINQKKNNRSINRIQERNIVAIGGRVGGEIKYTVAQNGMKRASFNLSTGKYFQNKSGEKECFWHSVVAWGNKADQVTEFLKTGDKVIILGRIHRRNYIDKQNQQRIFTEVVLKNFTK